MEPEKFSDEGQDCFIRLSSHFDKIFFRYVLGNIQSGEYLGICSEFHQKLARAAFFNCKVQTLRDVEVISCFFELLKHCLSMIFEKLEREKLDEYPLTSLFEGYFINILTELCSVTQEQADLLARSVKKFTQLRSRREPIPIELNSVIENNIPLVGDKESPLNKEELKVLQNYLGSTKSMYTHILLGSLFEMGKHRDIFLADSITEKDLISICNSSWFYLLTFYHLND